MATTYRNTDLCFQNVYSLDDHAMYRQWNPTRQRIEKPLKKSKFRFVTKGMGIRRRNRLYSFPKVSQPHILHRNERASMDGPWVYNRAEVARHMQPRDFRPWDGVSRSHSDPQLFCPDSDNWVDPQRNFGPWIRPDGPWQPQADAPQPFQAEASGPRRSYSDTDVANRRIDPNFNIWDYYFNDGPDFEPVPDYDYDLPLEFGHDLRRSRSETDIIQGAFRHSSWDIRSTEGYRGIVLSTDYTYAPFDRSVRRRTRSDSSLYVPGPVYASFSDTDLVPQSGPFGSPLDFFTTLLRGFSRIVHSFPVSNLLGLGRRVMDFVETCFETVAKGLLDFIRSAVDKIAETVMSILTPSVLRVIEDAISAPMRNYIRKMVVLLFGVILVAGGVLTIPRLYSVLAPDVLVPHGDPSDDTLFDLMKKYLLLGLSPAIVRMLSATYKTLITTALFTTSALTVGGALFVLIPSTWKYVMYHLLGNRQKCAEIQFKFWHERVYNLLSYEHNTRVLKCAEGKTAAEALLTESMDFRKDLGPSDSRDASRLTQRLEQFLERVRIVTTPSLRPEPFGMHVSGAPGAGKTSAVRKLVRAVTGWGDDEIYFRKVGKYWDGFHGQRVIIMDELFTMKDAVPQQTQELLDLINTGTYMPECASLSDPNIGIKGTRAEPRLVITMSNSPTPEHVADSALTPGARGTPEHISGVARRLKARLIVNDLDEDGIQRYDYHFMSLNEQRGVINEPLSTIVPLLIHDLGVHENDSLLRHGIRFPGVDFSVPDFNAVDYKDTLDDTQRFLIDPAVRARTLGEYRMATCHSLRTNTEKVAGWVGDFWKGLRKRVDGVLVEFSPFDRAVKSIEDKIGYKLSPSFPIDVIHDVKLGLSPFSEKLESSFYSVVYKMISAFAFITGAFAMVVAGSRWLVGKSDTPAVLGSSVSAVKSFYKGRKITLNSRSSFPSAPDDLIAPQGLQDLYTQLVVPTVAGGSHTVKCVNIGSNLVLTYSHWMTDVSFPCTVSVSNYANDQNVVLGLTDVKQINDLDLVVVSLSGLRNKMRSDYYKGFLRAVDLPRCGSCSYVGEEEIYPYFFDKGTEYSADGKVFYKTDNSIRVNVAKFAGFCGSALIQTDFGDKIFGIHTAGTKTQSLCIVVTREDVESILQGMDPSTEEDEEIFVDAVESFPMRTPTFGEPERQGSLEVMSVPRENRILAPADTKLKKSLLYDGTSTKQPAILSLTDYRNTTGKHPFTVNRDIMSQTVQAEWNEEHLDEAEAFVFDQLSQKLRKSFPGRELTLEEALNGIPGVLKGMNLKTGVGFPSYFVKRTKVEFLEEKNGRYRPTLLLRRCIKTYSERINEPDFQSVYVAFLKDELVKQSKIDEARTRVIWCGDFIANLYWRMKMGTLLAWFNTSGSYTPITIGLNQFSYDMQVILQDLLELSNWILAGDFKHFDQTTQKKVYDRVLRILLRLCPWLSQQDQQNFIKAWTRVAGVMGNVAVRPDCMHFSGELLTAILNSILNWLYFCCAFRAVTDAPLTDLRVKFMGDDHLATTRPDLQKVFSGAHLKEFFESHGLHYTSTDKSSTIVDYVHVGGVEYCGATAILGEEGYFGRPSSLMLNNTLQWTRNNNKTLVEEYVIACQMSSLCGEDYFNFYCERWKKRFDLLSIPVPPIGAWDDVFNNVVHRTAASGEDFLVLPQGPLVDNLLAPALEEGLVGKMHWMLPAFETLVYTVLSILQRDYSIALAYVPTGLMHTLISYKWGHDKTVCGYLKRLATHVAFNAGVQLSNHIRFSPQGLTTLKTDVPEFTSGVSTEKLSIARSVPAGIMTQDFPTDSLMFRVEFNWSSTDAVGTVLTVNGKKRLSIMRDILEMGQTTNIQNMHFANYLYWRGGIRITLQVNGTPFMQGALVAYFYPLSMDADKVNMLQWRALDHHVILTPHGNTTVHLDIPFLYPRDVINTYALQNGDDMLGTLAFGVLGPLSCHDPCSVSVSLFTSFPGSEFSIPRPQGASMSTTNNVTKYTITDSKVGNIPYEGRVGGVASNSTKVDTEARMDKLPLESGSFYISPAYSGMSKMIGSEPVVALKTHPGAMSRYDTGCATESRISALLSRCGLIDYFAWDTTMKSGTALFSCLMDSSFGTTKIPGRHMPTNLGILNEFCFWRADVELEFLFVKTPFHSGRIQATVGYGAPLFDATERNVFYNEVLDVNSETDSHKVLIPYNQAIAMLRTYEGSAPKHQVQDYSLGHLRVFVQNQLVAPETVDQSIKILLFVSLLNAKVAVPRPISMVTYDNVDPVNVLHFLTSIAIDTNLYDVDSKKRFSLKVPVASTYKQVLTALRATLLTMDKNNEVLIGDAGPLIVMNLVSPVGIPRDISDMIGFVPDVYEEFKGSIYGVFSGRYEVPRQLKWKPQGDTGVGSQPPQVEDAPADPVTRASSHFPLEYTVDTMEDFSKRLVRRDLESSTKDFRLIPVDVSSLVMSNYFAGWRGNMRFRFFTQEDTNISFIPSNTQAPDLVFTGSHAMDLPNSIVTENGRMVKAPNGDVFGLKRTLATGPRPATERTYQRYLDIAVPFETHLNFLVCKPEMNFPEAVGYLELEVPDKNPRIFVGAGDDFRFQVYRPPLDITWSSIVVGSSLLNFAGFGFK